MSEYKNIESGHIPVQGGTEPVKNKAGYIYEIAFFHDQKSDAHFKSRGDIPEEFGRWVEQHQTGESNADLGQNVKVFQDTMQKIDQAELEEKFSDDEEQKVLLEKKKQEAKELIDNLLRKIEEYLQKVALNVRAQKSSKESESYAQVLMETDKNRSRAHNALLDALRITIRNISHNFANIDAAALEKWEEHLEKHGQEMLMVKRQDFSSKIICPDNVDVNDRNSVAQWASKLHHSLSELSEKMK